MENRSFWGWGRAERFPDETQRRALADRLERELGFPALTLRDPPTIEDCSLPEPRLSIPESLEAFTTNAKEDRIRHTYGKSYPDLVRGFEGRFGPAPDLVARPPDEDAIVALLDWASDNDVAVIPFGGGTSVVGGIEPDLTGSGAMDPPDGGDSSSESVRSSGEIAGESEGEGADESGGEVAYGSESEVADESGGEVADESVGETGGEFAGVVSVSLRKFDDILAVDTESRRAKLQAGLLGPEINQGLAADGLQLRHYPQSYEFSTLGGWIATRAGGHFATVYTHIDDFVESVRAVTPAGVLETRDVPASGAGPDPNRFLLGSEGAFGIVTEAWLRVQPRPEYRARASVRFDRFWDGVRATRDVVQARLYPANCRLLDPTEAMINEVATDGSSILVLGFESVDHPVDSRLERALELCRMHGGRCPDGPSVVEPNESGETEGDDRHDDTEGDGQRDDIEGDGQRDDIENDGQRDDIEGDGHRGDTEADWRRSFFEGPYLFNQLVSMGVLVDTFETAVTWDRFSDLHETLQREVVATMTEECGMGVLSCRFTHVYPDGPAPYYTLLAPAEEGRELEQWRRIKATASDVLVDHGATITHHHAVGRVHRDWYAQEVSDRYLASLRSMKQTLDPSGIMNPGALFE